MPDEGRPALPLSPTFQSLNHPAVPTAQPPQDVEMVQFMGKDNVPFHTVIFPATQVGWSVDRLVSWQLVDGWTGGWAAGWVGTR